MMEVKRAGVMMWSGCGRTLQDSTGEFGWPVQNVESTSKSMGVGGTTSTMSVAEPCQWRISGTHGERIIVNVTELRLASSDCVTDYLEVRDGHWYRSPLIGQHTLLLLVLRITNPLTGTVAIWVPDWV